jgi:molybdopterin-containing oxidoreductase family membrane subunit
VSAISHVPSAARRGSGYPAWLGLLAGGMAVGGVCFVWQWSRGLGVTGLSNTVSWGMYIITFMFLVGVSAGGLIVVAGSELIGTERFAPLARLAVIVSGTAIAAAAVSILPDLGRPQAAWRLLFQPHLTSPLVWDVAVIAIYLSIAAIDLWIMTRPDPRPGLLRKVAFVALPVAVLVHSVTAWIFGLLVARPFWNTALLAPLFVSSALVSGTSLLLLVAYVVRRVTDWEPPRHIFPDLARLMVWFIGADAFLLFAEILTTYASRQPDHLDQLHVLLFGRLAWVFWTEILVGVVVPFAVFASPRLRTSTAWLASASALALVGVFFKRINILMSALFEPLVGLQPGIPGGRPGQPFRPDQIYIPTWVEWGILIGIASFIGLLITLGVRYLVLPERRMSETPVR